METKISTKVSALIVLAVIAIAAAAVTSYLALIPVTIGKTFSSTSLQAHYYPLSINKPIYGFQLEGAAKLNNPDNGLVRVVLLDGSGNEYLVFESYALMANNSSFTISSSTNNDCVETCKLSGVVPTKLRIETQNASLTLKNFTYSDSAAATKSLDSGAVKAKIETGKIKSLAENIKKRNLTWVAGETAVSKLSYAQKKKLFADKTGQTPTILPNLQGLEYYKGGVFRVKSKNGTISNAGQTSGLPDRWDWRKVNSKNYVTPIKDQGANGTCSYFSFIASLESQINLYYNQNLNLNLSEQQALDCPEPVMHSGKYYSCGGWAHAFTDFGVADEACDPYVGQGGGNKCGGSVACCDNSNVCSDWKNRAWRYNSFLIYLNNRYDDPNCDMVTKYVNSAEDIKAVLVHNGPLDTQIIPMGHSMALIGYAKIAPNFESVIDIVGNIPSEINGKTAWLFKNSWGSDWGEKGYGYFLIDDLGDFAGLGHVIGPFIPPTGKNISVVCEDRDKDGYYNWGSGNDRTNCPTATKGKYYKDADDNNPNITCIPYCLGQNCGSDGCGGSCGSCSTDKYCIANQCVFKQVSCAIGQQIGDVNGDLIINQTDREYVADIKTGNISTDNICCSDVSGDGQTNSADGIMIDQIMKGLKPKPGKCPIITCLSGQRLGDLNNDNQFNQIDVDYFDALVRQEATASGDTCCIDMNKDGQISAEDRILLWQTAFQGVPSPGLCPITCKTKRLIGDIREDRKINTYDISLFQKITEGDLPVPENICCVDLDNDGQVTGADYELLSKINFRGTKTGYCQ